MLQNQNFNPNSLFLGSYYHNRWIGSPAQYALYEIITDRFIYCSNDSRSLVELSNIFSSRYHLKLVRLDQANNFNSNLIDNECVLNWSASDIRTLPQAAEQYLHNCTYAKNLITKETIDTSELVYQDQPYLNYAYNIIKWTNNIIDDIQYSFINDENLMPPEAESSVRFYVDVIDQPIKNLEGMGTEVSYLYQKKMYNIMYHEHNFELAQQQVNQLIKQIYPGYVCE